MLMPSSETAIPVRSIVFLAIAGFASQAMVRVTDSLLPQIAADFGATVGNAAIVVTAYGIGHGASQLFLGTGGDRLGKYRAGAITCGLAAVLVFACALVPTLTWRTGEHITGTRFETIMNPTTGTSSLTWHASTPMTLDIDSMQALSLLAALEQEFEVEIPDYEVQDVRTFRELAAVVASRL